MRTLGENIIDWLQAYGVDTVFGIPGVHTVELYRGLADSGIHHVTARHEQGAGFMADGYARATGKPGVAFVITGPGLTNILTPMAQAYGDSIPMLVISSVNATGSLGMEAGDLHEIRNQSLIAAQAAAFSHTVLSARELPDVFARAWAVFEGARPRPVHIQIPVDLLSEAAQLIPVRRAAPLVPPVVDRELIVETARILAAASRPLVLCGGGVAGAPKALRSLAENLGAPVVMTVNARGVMPADHPLGVSASPSLRAIRAAIVEADVVLAVGTEIGRTDYDMYDRAPIDIPGRLIRLDVDPQQMHRGALPEIALVGDAGQGLAALAMLVGERRRPVTSPGRAMAIRDAAWEEIGENYRLVIGFLNTIRESLPGAIIVGDSTQATYAGNLYYAAPAARRWFGAATGYGALGYALPAAIGAARGTGEPVVVIAGDGGVQFSLAELGTAVEEELTVIVLVWNNRGYGEIKSHMVARQIKPVGVDLHTPDFVAIGTAYGIASFRLQNLDELSPLLEDAGTWKGPTLIEIDEAVVLG